MNNLPRDFECRPLHKLIVPVLLSASLVLGHSGCHFSKPELPGKWQETGHEETIEFHRDGRFTVAGPGKPETGNWTMTEADRVELELNILGKVYSFDGELAGELLRIRTPDGEMFEYYKLDTLHATKKKK